MLIDMFCKTHASGGKFDVATLIKSAREACLDALCIADIGKSSHVDDVLSEAEALDFFVVVGVEIRCIEGDIVCIPVEVDNDFVEERWKEELGERPSLVEAVNYFRDMGAAVIARNVYTQGHGMRDKVFSIRGFSAIDSLSLGRRNIDNQLAMEASEMMKIPGVAGSGSYDSLDLLGQVVTLCNCGTKSQRCFVEALLSGEAWAVSTVDMGTSCPEGSGDEVEDKRARERRVPRQKIVGGRQGRR